MKKSVILSGRCALRSPRVSAVKAPRESVVQAQQKPFEIVDATIEDVHAEYKAGRLTARALVRAYLDRIEAYDKNGPKINSVITINPKALEEADALDAAYKKSGPVGPLHGIPVVLKDQMDVAGIPTTLGSVVFKDNVPTQRRVRDREVEEGRRDRPREGDARRDGRRRFVRLALRRVAQSVRSRAHRRRIVGRHGRRGLRELRDDRRRAGRVRLDPSSRPPGTASSACGRRQAW